MRTKLELIRKQNKNQGQGLKENNTDLDTQGFKAKKTNNYQSR